MSRNHLTFSSEFLTAVGEATGFFSWPLEGTNAWTRQQMKRKKRSYDTLYRLKKQGSIKEISKNGRIFLKLTSKGQLELLIHKAGIEKDGLWDKQWRIIIFDIPEDCNAKRDALRRLLKKNSFVKLQASVFISPYSLNREAVSYLKQSGLINYIRLIRANEIDDDKDLKKKFNLS
jgi:CRISPR-associated endonuclease Cas2